MYVWFLQVECFYVVTEALEALTETVTVRLLLLQFYHWLERNLNMLGLANKLMEEDFSKNVQFLDLKDFSLFCFVC